MKTTLETSGEDVQTTLETGEIEFPEREGFVNATATSVLMRPLYSFRVYFKSSPLVSSVF